MALGKKVKTLYLNYADGTIAAGTDEYLNTIASHTFQDDVRVIGCQVGLDPAIPDAAVNADHQFALGVECSRHGQAQQDGALATLNLAHTFSAAVVVSSGRLETSPFCFPDGHGIDFDDGEVIYLHAHEINVGTVTIECRFWAIVYYVER